MGQAQIFQEKEGRILIQSNLGCLCVEVVTKRLFIRSYLDKDFNQCLSLYGNKEITRYFDHGNPRNNREIVDYVKERGGWYFNKSEPFGLFSVFLKENDVFIGQVDLVPTEVPGEVEIGWIFHQQFHNKGYCSEAILEFLLPFINKIHAKGIKSKGILVHRVIATAHPENIASIKVIQKAGLVKYQFKKRYQENPRNWYACSIPININNQVVNEKS